MARSLQRKSYTAREYVDGHAQWLARQVHEGAGEPTGSRWLNLLWFDPTILGRRSELDDRRGNEAMSCYGASGPTSAAVSG